MTNSDIKMSFINIIRKYDIKLSTSNTYDVRNSRNAISKSVINLSTLDYEKIAELQNKFDKFNQPKCALKVDREHSVAHILSNMEQDKIQELRAKFENLNMKRAAANENNNSDQELDEAPKRKSYTMEEFRKVRESIAKTILEREMMILDKKRIDVPKKVTIKSLTSISYINDSEKRRKMRNIINRDGENYVMGYSTGPQDDLYANGNDFGSLDATYRKITKNYSSFLIWRVENLQLIPVPKDQYGTFYNKDCYVIYAATQYGKPSGPQTTVRDIRGRIEYHIHFWLGNAISSDRAGVAAYKTVELDNYLGGSATQHREVQGKESPRFKSYFTHGMKVLSGGLESSYRRVDDTFEARLFRMKGTRVSILTQMANISWEYFNSGDVLLLHTKTILFVWIGRSANPIEKLHATKSAIQLRTEYDTPNLIFVDDGYEKTLEDDDREEFEKYLLLDERQVKAADENEDEAISEKRYRSKIKLYQCCDHNGKYRVTETKTGPLAQEDLNRDDVFIIDQGLNGIWAWVGQGVIDKERKEALRNARGFVKKKKYPWSTPVTRVVDGSEPIEFKSLFTVWQEKEEVKIAPFKNKIAVVKVTKFDAQTMHDHPALAAKSQLLDDGTGHMRMWRIKRFEAIEIPKERFGIFFTSDCYVVAYNYKSTNGMKCMIYYWMGHNSIPDEQGVAALKSIELDTTTAYGKAIHARIWQGKEPAHFLQLFKGRMCVFNGRGTDFDVSSKNLKTPNHCLLHIQGSASYNTRATQVALKASSLNSNYCFVLRKGNVYYIWCGSSSTGDNREMAKLFAGPEFNLLLEGSESPDFWTAICGKHSYSSYKLPEFSESKLPPRLFQCSTSTGFIKAEEIINYVQKDLSPEDVMLLDSHITIYLWIGNQSTSEEQRLSFETAIEYLRTDPCGRDMKTPIIQLRQGFEPPTFTGFFEVWDDKMWKKHKTYEELRSLVETRIGSSDKFISSRNNSDTEFDKYHKYSINILRGPVENLPSSVDPLRKELHLTYDDFTTIFNMEYKEFEKIPLWKQQEMKKQVGLF